MPTYCYHCSTCNFDFEEFHAISETVKICPDCGGNVDRVISGFAPHVNPVHHYDHPEHSKWFYSDDTQAKLKSGELRIIPKGERYI